MTPAFLSGCNAFSVGPWKAGKEHALRLACSLAGLGITFGMETRANDITGGLMQALVEAGLSSLLLGIESGRSQVLQRLGKHTSIAQNELAIALVRETGLEPEIGFIMFDAASTLRHACFSPSGSAILSICIQLF
jgi:anaerobic magnesium-protoporphyrin IX monomethyl ester cyclase